MSNFEEKIKREEMLEEKDERNYIWENCPKDVVCFV